MLKVRWKVGVWSRVTNHEIPLHKRDLIGKAFAGSMCSCPLDLVGIVVQTNDITSSECRNLPGRFANTTSNIENSHRLIDLDSMSKVVLVARESLE